MLASAFAAPPSLFPPTPFLVPNSPQSPRDNSHSQKSLKPAILLDILHAM
jgi:hypothetical protein